MSASFAQADHIQASHYFEENTLSFFDILIALARQLKVIIITPSIFCFLSISGTRNNSGVCDNATGHSGTYHL